MFTPFCPLLMLNSVLSLSVMVRKPFLPCIYGLVDPLQAREFRYIGQTRFEERLKAHWKEAIKTHKLNKMDDTTYKINWILTLFMQERMYLPIVIKQFPEDVSKELLDDAEIKCIAYFKLKGHRLTNATDGGDGGNRSLETRRKISLHSKNNSHYNRAMARVALLVHWEKHRIEDVWQPLRSRVLIHCH